MSDYLGPNQTRVLDSTNHSFESVIYQKRKPPLSSEVNLGGSIEAGRSQKAVQSLIPSGWTAVGRIVDDVSESSSMAGDALCSSSFPANSFKLIALDKGQEAEKCVALVNGWRVLVQGSQVGSSLNTNENNLIECPTPNEIDARVDFVFLEVWRKLVVPEDVVYPKYGNVLYYGTWFNNDLIDPAMGIETALRIQTQYRIRVAALSDTDFSLFPDGFSSEVHVQGPMDEPNESCSHSTYTQVSGDPGLWIAGAGDSIAQEILETVDGHVYAIPMFLVRRRSKKHYNPPNFIGASTSTSGSIHTLAEYLSGISSDRPDDLYNDRIVASDILDIRHKVPVGNLDSLCADAFKKLQANKLPGVMSLSNVYTEDSYGAHIVQRDTLSGTGTIGSTYPLSLVPTKFLEARMVTADATNTNQYLPIAMKDQDIRVRYGDGTSPCVTSLDGTNFHMLRNRGGSYIDYSDFGHQLVYHVPGTGDKNLIVPKSLFGYTILGIQNISYDGTATLIPVSIGRSSTEYAILLAQDTTSAKDVELTLYTATKFFDANKQIKSVTDCFEMYEYDATLVPGEQVYIIDTGSTGPKAIRAIGSYAGADGYGFYYEGGDLHTITGTKNNDLRFTLDSTRISIDLGDTPGSSITIPILVRSVVDSGQNFDVIYDALPYQGLLDTSTTGTIEAVGPAITTSAGSGAITDFTYNVGTADFGSNQVLTGHGTEWCCTSCQYVRTGYVFCADTDATRQYLVTKINSDTEIILNATPVRTGTTESYKIVAKDRPSFNNPNIIDRFPTLDSALDTYSLSETLSTSYLNSPTIENKIAVRVQDITDIPSNFAEIGKSSANRGRNEIHFPEDLAPLGIGNLGLNFESLPSIEMTGLKKTFQSYILNKENSGRLYLMVVGSETDNDSQQNFFSPYTKKDVVDLFELPGRPLMTNSERAGSQWFPIFTKPVPPEPIIPA
jgi:hypothetical protein